MGTFTAFQSIIAEELPQTSATLLIDYYIGFAYLLQFMLVFGTCVTALDIGDIEIDVGLLDVFLGIALAIVWISFSFFYISLQFKPFRLFYDKLCCACCCLGKANY